MAEEQPHFKPFIAPEDNVKEFTLKALVLGSIFGILFGAATVYLALKAGLTVSASIPIAVLAITLEEKYSKPQSSKIISSKQQDRPAKVLQQALFLPFLVFCFYQLQRALNILIMLSFLFLPFLAACSEH